MVRKKIKQPLAEELLFGKLVNNVRWAESRRSGFPDRGCHCDAIGSSPFCGEPLFGLIHNR